MSYTDFIGKNVRMGIRNERYMDDEGAIEYINAKILDVDKKNITYSIGDVKTAVPIYLVNQITLNGGGGRRRRRTKRAAKTTRRSRKYRRSSRKTRR
jgi:hypothetical protein